MFLHDFKERRPKIFYVLVAAAISLFCLFLIFGGVQYTIGLIVKLERLFLIEYDVIRLVPTKGM